MSEPVFEYVLTGRSHRGGRVTEIVEAHSADEAVKLFAHYGHTEIVLHTDDNSAPFQHPSKVRKWFTPRDYVRARTRGRLGSIWFMARKMYERSWWTLIFGVGFIVLAQQAPGPVGILEEVWAALLIFPILFAIVTDLASPVHSYRRMLRAVVYGRWEDVGRLIRRVRIPLPPFERPFREAQALAGLGRLDEALDHFRPVIDDPAIPPHLYWTYKAVIYGTARERGKSLDCVARAAELAPNNAVALIDHAVGLLTVRSDVARARERLMEARRHALSDVSSPLCAFAEGLLALKDRRPAEAVPILEAALRALWPFTRGTPSVAVIIARIRANLALAYAAIGEHEKARREYRKAEPILAAHDALELARCRDVLG